MNYFDTLRLSAFIAGEAMDELPFSRKHADGSPCKAQSPDSCPFNKKAEDGEKLGGGNNGKMSYDEFKKRYSFLNELEADCDESDEDMDPKLAQELEDLEEDYSDFVSQFLAESKAAYEAEEKKRGEEKAKKKTAKAAKERALIDELRKAEKDFEGEPVWKAEKTGDIAYYKELASRKASSYQEFKDILLYLESESENNDGGGEIDSAAESAAMEFEHSGSNSEFLKRFIKESMAYRANVKRIEKQLGED